MRSIVFLDVLRLDSGVPKRVVVLSNLVKGGRYTVWVHAINAVGPGPSLSVSFTQKR